MVHRRAIRNDLTSFDSVARFDNRSLVDTSTFIGPDEFMEMVGDIAFRFPDRLSIHRDRNRILIDFLIRILMDNDLSSISIGDNTIMEAK